MTKNIRRRIIMKNYREINSEMHKTGIFEFLDKNGLKKEYNGEDCVAGNKPDCIFCLLPDYNLRLALYQLIKNSTFKKVEMYQDVLLRKAEKTNDEKLERLSSIINASLSY